MSDITRADGSALAIRPDQGAFDSTQIAALRAIGAEQASPSDLAVYFHYCQRTGLDPFAKQIYLIGRNDNRSGGKKWTIQTSIDGLRLVARRATDAAKGTLGYEDTQWCDADGKWVDVWLQDTNPSAARVTVLRDGQRFTGIALWKEYKQNSPTWTSMPSLMLAKCAEALALRKAFPNDLAGLYTDDEGDRGISAEPPARSVEDVAALTAEFYARAVAATGDSDALVAVYQDARAEGVLSNPVTHDGVEGDLGSLIIHLRTQAPLPTPETESATEPVIEDAVVVDADGVIVEDPPADEPAPPKKAAAKKAPAAAKEVTDHARSMQEQAAASWGEGE